KIGPVDLVLAGFKSADGETGQTGPQTALMLGMPILTHTTKLEVFPEEGTFEAERLVQDEIEECVGPLPAFIVTDPAFESSFTKASERLTLLDIEQEQAAKAAEHEEHLTKWDVEAIGVDENKVGLKGSPTIVRQVDPIPKPPSEREPEMLQGDDPDAIKKVARIIVEKGGL
ncbi:MAG: electron transfer flavoprotein subunit beta/FixA family protein, partial [Candidatus Thermoplasmatota archaeon]|nr:electron transfer flavoprotein subunit beta/FixA family protein [Candidatus Thermoplasmatota archaeon]